MQQLHATGAREGAKATQYVVNGVEDREASHWGPAEGAVDTSATSAKARA